MWAWAARRPTPVLLTAAVVAELVVATVLALGDLPLQPMDALTTVALAVAGAGAIALLPHVDPAYPISLGIAMTMFSGWWGQMGLSFGLDRPLLVYGILAVAVRSLPDLRRTRPPRIGPLAVLLAVVALYALTSSIVVGTFGAREAQFALLDRLGVIGFLLFVVAPSAFATRRARDVLLVTLIVVGAYLGVIALLERLDLNGLIFPRYITNPYLGILPDRSRGPFLEPAANGLALFTCGVAATIGLVQWRRRPPVAALCVLVIGLCGLGIVLTLTRQIWLGSAVATLLTLLAARPLRRYAIPATALGTVGVVAALALIPGLQTQAVSRANSQSPVWDRLNSNRAGLAMIDAKPLTGFGFYTWAYASPAYYRQARTYPLSYVTRPHNVFLSYFIELGLIGGSLWLVAFGWAVISGLRRGPPPLELWRLGFLAVAADFVVVANFTPLGYAYANDLIWLWAGLAAGAAGAVVRSGPLRPEAARQAAPPPARELVGAR